MSDKIYIKRKKNKSLSTQEIYNRNFEEWVGYWRSNPHRFIMEYLGLELYDFQRVVLCMMDEYPQFIYVASRGLAKSTISLLFSIERCILYPGQKIGIVTPVKNQSSTFIKKVNEFIRKSPNLKKEIYSVKTGQNEASIKFNNGSELLAFPHSENALGARLNILIVDEYVRTDKNIINRVFVPMLTSPRKPPYKGLSYEERAKIKPERQRQLYLSSIRGADEWSYEEFEKYVDHMIDGDMDYITVALPYMYGVKAGYIDKKIVEQQFIDNQDSVEVLMAEYSAIPERGVGNSFFKYQDLEKARTNIKPLISMSDEEYIEFKNNKNKWPYYVEKLPNEIRILSMDVAVIESKNNDNSMFWVIRLIPDNGVYKKIIAYGESMHGINSIVQAKRAKQLFYEMECDYFVLDCSGVGIGVFDACSNETYDEVRDITYPAWTVVNYEDIKMDNRVISPNAMPIVYAVKTPIQLKSEMFLNMRNMITTDMVSLLVDSNDGIDYLNKTYKFYKIEDNDLRTRMLQSYAETSILINEAVNLEQVVTQGYINLKEKSGRRKDRVMSLAYGLYYAKILEDEYKKQNDDLDILDYVLFA